jgi:NADH-ubiquinone oxidoreductase chain 3
LINLVLAPHNPYQEKDSVFECGFHSFLGQNRAQFSVSFFMFGFVFIALDLEIVLLTPFCVSAYHHGISGLVIMMVFFTVLTLGFVFELGKNALSIDSKQNLSYKNEETPAVFIIKSPQRSSMFPPLSRLTNVSFTLWVHLDKDSDTQRSIPFT